MPAIEFKDILTLLDPLIDHDVLTAADAEQVTTLAEQAHNATALARNFAATRQVTAATAAEALLAKNAPITPDRFTKAVHAMSAVDDAELIGVHVERAATQQARAIVIARAAELPAILTAELDTLTARADELFAALRAVTTAAEAINYDRAAEWRELCAVKSRLAELLGIVDKLRAHKLIPGPRREIERGQHWTFRLPSDTAGFRAAHAADDDGMTMLRYTTARKPWVPTAEQAEDVAAAWNREESA